MSNEWDEGESLDAEYQAGIDKGREEMLIELKNKDIVVKMLQKFIAFIGEGNNKRGKFPKNLSELDADVTDFLTYKED